LGTGFIYLFIYFYLFFFFVYCTDQGGAFFYHVDENGFLNINHTVFAGCYSSGDGGGAVAIHGVNNLIDNTAFLFCVSWGSNTDDDPVRIGGGIRFWITDGTLKNCSFINCGSNTSGGALGHARYKDTDENVPKGKTITLINCILASNWASKYGGAIIMRQENYVCVNCSFLHN
jgi:hypothetical protein